eukprot:scaffold211702_cov27-Tisochrysis_lutea.AAC.7
MKCAVGTSVWFLRQRAALSRPVIPAAALAWPTFPFTEPIAQKLPRVATSAGPAPAFANASVSERASIPSPTSVPVAWHSTMVSEAALTAAWASAALTVARWPATPGAA